VHKYMRTHGSEGATELGRDGPGPVGPSRPAWPTLGVGSVSFFLHPKTFNLKFVEAPPFAKGREPFAGEAIHKLERRGVSGFSTAGSKFLSIVCRARMVSAGDNRVYTSSGLQGVIPYI
jgi:hypothetical protein